MIPILENRLLITRRHFFGRASTGLGVAALAAVLNGRLFPASDRMEELRGAAPSRPHFTPKAKRVIYLFQSGAPSQMDLFDYKPKLAEWRGTELPSSIRQGQRLTPHVLIHTRLWVNARRPA